MEIRTASLAAGTAKSFSHFHTQLRDRITKIFNRKNRKTKQDGGLYRLFAPSLICICICAVCLCGSSLAWFTASASVGTAALQSPSYKLSCRINGETVSLAEAGTDYTLTDDTCVVTLTAVGTTGANGYCRFQIANGKTVYYTESISVGDTFTFTVNAATGTTITLIPQWGSYSGTANLSNNGTIGTPSGSSSSQSDTQVQAQNGTATAEESAAESIPSNTPTEDTSTAAESVPDLAPSEESSDTDPDVVQETSTTETPTELPAAAEIENN